MQRIPAEDLNIDRKERVYLPYLGREYRPARERIYDFQEVAKSFDIQRAKYEASRCIHCPDPAACVEACPLHNDIPSAMWMIEQGDFLAAASIFRETSAMPEICGRICPQEILCEGACVLSQDEEAVTIGALEFFSTDYEHSVQFTAEEKITPKYGKVAVVGGGPSGLACAEKLINLGYQVTVFDIKSIPGGLLIFGIPGFKLSNHVLLNKLNQLAQKGVRFETNIMVGKQRTIDDIFKEGYESIYIAVGAGNDVTMDIPGEELWGVLQAKNFLIRANAEPSFLPPGLTTAPQIGKRTAIIGGGDTASDCIRTAIRLGVESVTCIYRRSEDEMPGVQKDRLLAREEGAEFLFQTLPIRFIGNEQQKLTAIECIRTELGEPDENGRCIPIPVEGSNFIIEVDSAILALGYRAYPTISQSTPDLKTHHGGLIIANPVTGATSIPGVFAGGDVVRGPHLVVTAIDDGQRAAEAMHRYMLSKKEKHH